MVYNYVPVIVYSQDGLRLCLAVELKSDGLKKFVWVNKSNLLAFVVIGTCISLVMLRTL